MLNYSIERQRDIRWNLDLQILSRLKATTSEIQLRKFGKERLAHTLGFGPHALTSGVQTHVPVRISLPGTGRPKRPHFSSNISQEGSCPGQQFQPRKLPSERSKMGHSTEGQVSRAESGLSLLYWSHGIALWLIPRQNSSFSGLSERWVGARENLEFPLKYIFVTLAGEVGVSTDLCENRWKRTVRPHPAQEWTLI